MRRRGSHRPTGTGVSAELTWWQEYAAWGTDNQIPDVMTEAFDWLHRHQPDQIRRGGGVLERRPAVQRHLR